MRGHFPFETNGSQLSWVRGLSLCDWLQEPSHRHGSSGAGLAASSLLSPAVAFHQQGQQIDTFSVN